MKKSLHIRLKFLISADQKSKGRNLAPLETACLVERTLAYVQMNGEPDLPKGYRHVHSAIGALLTVGRDYGF